jgi:hypothetical protein
MERDVLMGKWIILWYYPHKVCGEKVPNMNLKLNIVTGQAFLTEKGQVNCSRKQYYDHEGSRELWI